MPFNPSGLFQRLYSWTSDRDSGINIDPERIDGETDGIVSAINEITAGNVAFRGPVRAPYGTAAAPGVTFEGDTNTGVARVAADTLGLTAGGVLKVSVSGAGVEINAPVTGSAVQTGAADATVGRLMLAQHGFSRGNVLDPITFANGVPTGGLMRSGTNANGDWFQYANGEQICTFTVTFPAPTTPVGSLYLSNADGAWTFPAQFAETPVIYGFRRFTGALWLVGPATEAADSTAQFRGRVASPLTNASGATFKLTATGRF